MRSYERHRWQIDCLLHSLFELKANNIEVPITGPFEGNPLMSDGFPSQADINAEIVSMPVGINVGFTCASHNCEDFVS